MQDGTGQHLHEPVFGPDSLLHLLHFVPAILPFVWNVVSARSASGLTVAVHGDARTNILNQILSVQEQGTGTETEFVLLFSGLKFQC